QSGASLLRFLILEYRPLRRPRAGPVLSPIAHRQSVSSSKTFRDHKFQPRLKCALASASFSREPIAAINTCAACTSTLLHELRIEERAGHLNSNCERQGRRYAGAHSWNLRE